MGQCEPLPEMVKGVMLRAHMLYWPPITSLRRGFGRAILFSSLPLRKSYEIKLEEFRCRDPSSRPPAGATTHSQVACRGNRLQPRLLQGRPHATPSRLQSSLVGAIAP
ncbi:hypothetical protein GW17_00049140 [Ensete ventricosum]|nr:hypothetical protein GW17_00049140 [Ensete ventricosum]RZS00897.1 hypothetical protein BHM03_00030678 [Ensete ventricosum]